MLFSFSNPGIWESFVIILLVFFLLAIFFTDGGLYSRCKLGIWCMGIITVCFSIITSFSFFVLHSKDFTPDKFPFPFFYILISVGPAFIVYKILKAIYLIVIYFLKQTTIGVLNVKDSMKDFTLKTKAEHSAVKEFFKALKEDK